MILRRLLLAVVLFFFALVEGFRSLTLKRTALHAALFSDSGRNVTTAELTAVRFWIVPLDALKASMVTEHGNRKVVVVDIGEWRRWCYAVGRRRTKEDKKIR